MRGHPYQEVLNSSKPTTEGQEIEVERLEGNTDVKNNTISSTATHTDPHHTPSQPSSPPILVVDKTASTATETTRAAIPSYSPTTNARHTKIQSHITALQSQILATQTAIASTLVQLRNTLPNSTVSNQTGDADATITNTAEGNQIQDPDPDLDTTTLTTAQTLVRNHMRLLHRYNEIKDIGLTLMGLIAEKDDQRLNAVMEKFGVDAND